MIRHLALLICTLFSVKTSFASEEFSKGGYAVECVLLIQKLDSETPKFTVRDFKGNDFNSSGQFKNTGGLNLFLEKPDAYKMQKFALDSDMKGVLGVLHDNYCMFPMTFNEMVKKCTKDSFDFSGLLK